MKTVKNYNAISDKLKAEIGELKEGQVVTLQFLNGRINPDEESKKKMPMLFGKQQVQTSFRVFDKYKTDSTGKEVGGFVDVVLAEDWHNDAPTKAKMFVAGFGEPFFLGKHDLRGDSMEDRELYEILWLSHEREDNPYRDKKVQPLFKFLNHAKENKEKVDKVKILKEALDLALTISDEDAQKVMASMNRSYPNVDDLKAAIAEEARTNPERLITLYKDKSKDVKALLKQGLDAGILKHDHVSGKLSLGNETLTTIAVKETSELISELAAWVNSATNGKDILEGLKKQLKKAEATA